MVTNEMEITKPEGEKHVTLGVDESMHIKLQDFEAGSRDFTLTVELQGDRAECHISGRAQSHGQDRKNWQVKQIFSGQDQTGSIDLRGTAEDQSFLAFDGAATLAQNSKDADANIEERIILFDQAKGRSLPVLRVETDAVKSASHGASIAPVSQEQVLYLQSRGIATSEAENMLKEGFLR